MIVFISLCLYIKHTQFYQTALFVCFDKWRLCGTRYARVDCCIKGRVLIPWLYKQSPIIVGKSAYN